MENIKSTQIGINKIEDIRQSEKWANYLHTLGWTSFRSSKQTNIEIRNTVFGKTAKIQRSHNLKKEELEEIDEICNKNKVALLKIEPSLDQNFNLMEEIGYIETTAYLIPTTTMYIDLLKNENDLWNSISHSGKYSIKRAVREGANTKFIKNPSDEVLKNFQKLHSETATKKHFRQINLEELKNLRDIFEDECFVGLVFNKNNKLCGGKMYLGHKGIVWYMHGGTNSLGRTNKTGYELQWQAILYFKKHGYELLDLEGVDDERVGYTTTAWGGFSYFKEKFGGIKVEYPMPRVRYYSKVFEFLAKHGFGNIF